MNTEALIKEQIKTNPILLYMKGNKDFPMCGFSARVAGILNELAPDYKSINVLEHPEIRATLPIVADWPTFPQLYVNGELIGGCDIITEMFKTGELQKLLIEQSDN